MTPGLVSFVTDGLIDASRDSASTKKQNRQDVASGIEQPQSSPDLVLVQVTSLPGPLTGKEEETGDEGVGVGVDNMHTVLAQPDKQSECCAVPGGECVTLFEAGQL